MFYAVFRLAAITMGTITVAILGVVLMRWVGLQQQYAAPPHPWFERTFWWVHQPGPQEYCNVVKARPDWAIAVPVRKTNGQWFIPCPEPIPVGEMLSKSAQTDWILRVEAKETGSLDTLIDAVAAHDRTKRFAVLTDSQQVARYLRKKAPQWLFAADPATLLRLHMFTSLWLETGFDFWPDFVIASADPRDAGFLHPREVDELKRRQKRVLWNDFETTAEKPDYPIQGVLTGRPLEAKQRYQQID